MEGTLDFISIMSTVQSCLNKNKYKYQYSYIIRYINILHFILNYLDINK